MTKREIYDKIEALYKETGYWPLYMLSASLLKEVKREECPHVITKKITEQLHNTTLEIDKCTICGEWVNVNRI